jgi:hypothetical protein
LIQAPIAQELLPLYSDHLKLEGKAGPVRLTTFFQTDSGLPIYKNLPIFPVLDWRLQSAISQGDNRKGQASALTLVGGAWCHFRNCSSGARVDTFREI